MSWREIIISKRQSIKPPATGIADPGRWDDSVIAQMIVDGYSKTFPTASDSVSTESFSHLTAK